MILKGQFRRCQQFYRRNRKFCRTIWCIKIHHQSSIIMALLIAPIKTTPTKSWKSRCSFIYGNNNVTIYPTINHIRSTTTLSPFNRLQPIDQKRPTWISGSTAADSSAWILFEGNWRNGNLRYPPGNDHISPPGERKIIFPNTKHIGI